MNVLTGISIIDMKRIKFPFSIPYLPSFDGVGRSIESSAVIPHGTEPEATSIGRSADAVETTIARPSE
jgi:hypothetical protein